MTTRPTRYGYPVPERAPVREPRPFDSDPRRYRLEPDGEPQDEATDDDDRDRRLEPGPATLGGTR
jgi:hypothetical protein